MKGGLQLGSKCKVFLSVSEWFYVVFITAKTLAQLLESMSQLLTPNGSDKLPSALQGRLKLASQLRRSKFTSHA
jgi:hypothetical protein